ncbi:hypothetical protein FA13DRAFT_1673181 [Coprinellus micaceus]|uniref:Uncharacterized protein n=1 Tax=Coprinellus micaceus TaxID=71717 RepID=A0A4Y7SE14_COPMI|nr:hypothetical protein FA13DRAFT_1673181 [Coprinellus micaceus]
MTPRRQLACRRYLRGRGNGAGRCHCLQGETQVPRSASIRRRCFSARVAHRWSSAFRVWGDDKRYTIYWYSAGEHPNSQTTNFGNEAHCI